ncbi:uncharacterized protein TNCV_2431051 [Trichonephila clavipes]|nr:uncharacterized protein TNCV_2431051 [Trichonephila clavipes]
MPRSRALPNDTLPYGILNQVMIEIYKSSPNAYYIYVPNITFPSFVDNHILPCPVGTRLNLHGYASDRFANVQFLRTEAGFLYKQNRFPYFNRGEMVTPDALRAFILHGFKHFPSLKMKYNTTMVSIWARGQWFWTLPGIVPGGWTLEAYLQLKPLRHARGKRIVTSLNELWGKRAKTT